MKKWKEIFAGKKAVVLIFAILLVGVCILGFAASSGKSKTETAQAVNTESAVKDEAVDVEDNTAEETVEIKIDPAYQLVWEDEFEGTELNRNDWNVELHDPGWVNAEWQEYVDCEDNIYVKDGNLVIQPIKMKVDHKDYYTSGREAEDLRPKYDKLLNRLEKMLNY